MAYRPEKFELYELVPREAYESLPVARRERLWFVFDIHTLITLSRLRTRYGRTTINDWYWDGNNQYRGWRPPDCKIGAALSQHRFGRGFDCSFEGATAEEVREDIMANDTDPDFEFITCIEMDVTWLHFDTRNWDRQKDGILKVYP